MDEAIAMSMFILQRLRNERISPEFNDSTDGVVRELMDDVLVRVEQECFSTFKPCDAEKQDFSQTNIESHVNKCRKLDQENSSIKSEFEDVRELEYEINRDTVLATNADTLLNQEFTDYEELNSMFLNKEDINSKMDIQDRLSTSEDFSKEVDEHSLPDTPSPEPMEFESNVSTNLEVSGNIKSESRPIDINVKLNSDVRKSSRRTKGVNHHDFFPSDLLNFKYINTRIQKYPALPKSFPSAKKNEAASTSVVLCEPSTSRASPEGSTFLDSENDLVNELLKQSEDDNNEFYNKRVRGRKRKIVRRERNFNCANYIYRPDFDDCTEEELRKLYQYLKLRTKGFVRSQPQEIIIDNFPIQYFANEASMKDCATFDAFDRVCSILNQRYPSAAKSEMVCKTPSNPKIVEFESQVKHVPDIELIPSSDSEESVCSEDLTENSVAKKQKSMHRPHFKIRGRHDIRNISFDEALKEFKKPTSNGKYDGPIPVSVLKQARDDNTFDGPVIAKKVVSLLEKIEAQPSKPKAKRQIFKQLDLKSNLAAHQKNKPNIQTASPSNYIPINRSISGTSTYMPVSQLYKKPSCKVTIRSSNLIGRSTYGLNNGKIRQQIILPSPVRKLNPSLQSSHIRPVPRASIPAQSSSYGKYPILKSAISGQFNVRHPLLSGDQTYKAVFSRPLSPSKTDSTEQTPGTGQRPSLLTASSFNPPPAVAARRKLQIVGSGSKTQVIDKSSITVSGQSTSFLNGTKYTKILTSIPNQPSYLKEIPRETYSKGPQISLLQSSNPIPNRVLSSTSSLTATTAASTPEQIKAIPTDSKAAMVNLAKPLILYSEPSSGNRIFTSTYTTVSRPNASSPVKTYVRLAPTSISSAPNFSTQTQMISQKSLLNKSINVSSSIPVPTVRNLPSGTSISIVKHLPVVSSDQIRTPVTTMTSISATSSTQNSLLKNLTTPISGLGPNSTSQPPSERPSLNLSYPTCQKILITNPPPPPPVSSVSQPASTDGLATPENRTWLTPISGTKFAIHPTQPTPPNIAVNRNLLVPKKFPNDNSLSLINNDSRSLMSSAPTMATNNVNLVNQKSNIQRVLVKSVLTTPNSATASPMVIKLYSRPTP